MTSKRGNSPRSTKTSKGSHTNEHPAVLTFSRYLFFGGKGGVGKTTIATATALFLLGKAKNDEAILLFSTDPAHSLSDSLAIEVGDRLVEVSESRGARLIAYEMNAAAALERFRDTHGKVLAEIAERGTFLDEADIDELLNLSLPGLDEVMALFELSELDRSGSYTHVVVDTAPSGHTTRLLRLPDVFARMSNALDRLAEKHRYILTQFARREVQPDEVDLFLRDLNERIGRVRTLLFDPNQTSFSLVTTPDPMSFAETQRYFDILRREGVPVTNLVVNRLEQEHAGCYYCRSRVAAQKPWLTKIAQSFAELNLRYVALLPYDVSGIASLKRFGQELWASSDRLRLSVPKRTTRWLKPDIAQVTIADDTDPLSFSQRRLVIFGGKGGVGKTTAAAASALALADRNPEKKILVLSTDPAHSLSDSFRQPLNKLKKGVAGRLNLHGMEIDPGKWFEELKRRYREWTDELFAALGGNSKLEIQFDREAMRELVELTPPGIDEIAALSAISDLLDKGEYETIIVDTAPTGHVIRFLELPHVALAWVRTFIRLLLKYQHIVHAGRVAEELVTLSQSIKRVLSLLTDATQCEFIGVAIPERMSLEETFDLKKSLQKLNVPLRRLLINGIVPDQATASCSFCASRRAAQNAVVADFRSLENSIDIFVAEQQTHDIRGAKQLLAHFDGWRKLSRVKHTVPPNSRRRPHGVKNAIESRLKK